MTHRQNRVAINHNKTELLHWYVRQKLSQTTTMTKFFYHLQLKGLKNIVRYQKLVNHVLIFTKSEETLQNGLNVLVYCTENKMYTHYIKFISNNSFIKFSMSIVKLQKENNLN